MDFVFHLLFSPLPTPAIISLFAVAAATLFYLNTRPSPLRAPADLKCQSLGIKVKSVWGGGNKMTASRCMHVTVPYGIQWWQVNYWSVDPQSAYVCLQDGARKTALLEDNNNLLSYYYENAKTIYEVFQRGLKVSGDSLPSLHQYSVSNSETSSFTCKLLSPSPLQVMDRA